MDPEIWIFHKYISDGPFPPKGNPSVDDICKNTARKCMWPHYHYTEEYCDNVFLKYLWHIIFHEEILKNDPICI